MTPSRYTTRQQRPRRAFPLGSLLLVLAGAGRSAFAGPESALDYIEPRLDRGQYALLCGDLALNRDQQIIGDLLIGDYLTAIARLAERVDERAEGAGREAVLDALAGKLPLRADELRRLRLNVLEEYQRGWPVADELLEQLLDDTRNMLTDEQASRAPAAFRRVRRAILLHPRQAGRLGYEYAGDGVDVWQLVEEASNEGGELEAIFSGRSRSAARSGEARESIEAILADYERRLDAVLIETAAAERLGRIKRRKARIQSDPEAKRREQQGHLARWRRLYELNDEAVRRIADVLERSLGHEPQQAWRDRFDRAVFPRLFSPTRPDRQLDFISRQSAVEAERQEQAKRIHDDFLARRNALNRRMAALVVRGRVELKTIFHSMMGSGGLNDPALVTLYEELLKITGEQTSLVSATAADLEALLDETQRAAMRKALRRGRLRR